MGISLYRSNIGFAAPLPRQLVDYSMVDRHRFTAAQKTLAALFCSA